MNIQALMKQAQSLQKDMMKAKEEIDNTLFTGSNSFVTVKVNGKKKVLDIKIDTDSVDKDDIEMLQDILERIRGSTMEIGLLILGGMSSLWELKIGDSVILLSFYFPL